MGHRFCFCLPPWGQKLPALPEKLRPGQVKAALLIDTLGIILCFGISFETSVTCPPEKVTCPQKKLPAGAGKNGQKRGVMANKKPMVQTQ